ncbi:MAG: hypothetical protein ISR65_12100 [Bacteriovoracaceae bacterium]|nr:hypothetical protein [Bacteriovoracaceae bacterium]
MTEQNKSALSIFVSMVKYFMILNMALIFILYLISLLTNKPEWFAFLSSKHRRQEYKKKHYHHLRCYNEFIFNSCTKLLEKKVKQATIISELTKSCKLDELNCNYVLGMFSLRDKSTSKARVHFEKSCNDGYGGNFYACAELSKILKPEGNKAKAAELQKMSCRIYPKLDICL